MASLKVTKVALINPPFTSKLLFFSLPYLLGSMRKYNLVADFKLFDCSAMEYTLDDLYIRLQEYAPDIVGISVPFTISLTAALHIAKTSRKLFPNALVVAGGAHASLCPEDLADKCDYVVIGSGDYALAEIVRAYQNQAQPWNIPGTVYCSNGQMVSIPRKQDTAVSMGDPDWGGINVKDFFSPRIFGSQEKGFSIFSSTGCPYNCTYCSNHLLTQQKVVYRDVKDIVAEIEWFQCNHKLNIFTIVDEIFTLNRERVIEFCDLLERKNLKIEWVFQTRANLVKDKDLFLRMRKAGAKAVSIGVESGNPDVLKANKGITIDTITQAVNMLKDVGLILYAGFIIGFPEDTIDTVWDTITFADRLDLDSPGFQLMVPYPKTRVREKALQEGGILTNDFSKYSTYGVVYVPPGLNGYDLLAIRKFAFQYFHTRTRKRVDAFLKRFVDRPDKDAIHARYNLMLEQRDKYNKDYLLTLKYSKDSKLQGEVEGLPI